MFPKPDEFFKKSFEQWEQQTAAYWDSLLRSPSFLKASWQMVEQSLHAQQQITEMMQQQWAAMNLPTREAQERILHQLGQLQIQVDELNERVDDMLQSMKEEG